jgi:hypothetical protein
MTAALARAVRFDRLWPRRALRGGRRYAVAINADLHGDLDLAFASGPFRALARGSKWSQGDSNP